MGYGYLVYLDRSGSEAYGLLMLVLAFVLGVGLLGAGGFLIVRYRRSTPQLAADVVKRPGTCCIACDKVIEQNQAVRGPVLRAPKGYGGGEMCSLWLCRACLDETIKNFSIEVGREPEARPQPTAVTLQAALMCNFCTRAATEVQTLVRLCGFYVLSCEQEPIPDEHGSTLHRVVHDKVFLFAHADNDPQHVGNVCICDDCVVRCHRIIGPVSS